MTPESDDASDARLAAKLKASNVPLIPEIQQHFNRAERLTSAEVLREFRQYDRDPFLRILARFVGCAPSPRAIALWAEENPDRWTYSVNVLSRIGGYSEKIELGGTVTNRFETLPDDKLMQEIERLKTLLEGSQTIEHKTEIEKK